MKLGEKIKELREQAGLTQEELAEKMEVQRNTVWRWENQKANLKAENIQKLSTILNVEPSELMEETDEVTALNFNGGNIPTKVAVSTKLPVELSGRLVVKDGNFYLNLPDTAEGYSALLQIINMRNPSFYNTQLNVQAQPLVQKTVM